MKTDIFVFPPETCNPLSFCETIVMHFSPPHFVAHRLCALFVIFVRSIFRFADAT